MSVVGNPVAYFLTFPYVFDEHPRVLFCSLLRVVCPCSASLVDDRTLFGRLIFDPSDLSRPVVNSSVEASFELLFFLV